MARRKRLTTCRLCAGKPFRRENDFKKLCNKHSTEVLAAVFIGFADDVVLEPARERRRERRGLNG